MKRNKKNIVIAMVVSIIIIISMSIYNSKKTVITGKNIENLTNVWINAVTKKNNPAEVAKLFCSDANLVGTVSQIKRRGDDIKKYFDYFAKLPEIKVVKKKYNISQVSKDVYVNTAFITWTWKGLKKPIVARMTFTFRKNCIFQLHSSALPDINDDLYKVSGAK